MDPDYLSHRALKYSTEGSLKDHRVIEEYHRYFAWSSGILYDGQLRMVLPGNDKLALSEMTITKYLQKVTNLFGEAIMSNTARKTGCTSVGWKQNNAVLITHRMKIETVTLQADNYTIKSQPCIQYSWWYTIESPLWIVLAY